MTVYPLGQMIPLFFVRTLGGSLVTGLTVTVKVLNAITGAVLLNTTALTEVTPGIYSYYWANGLTQFTQCIEIYTVSGQEYVNSFSVAQLAGSGGTPPGLQAPQLMGFLSQSEDITAMIQAKQEIAGALKSDDTIEGDTQVLQNVQGQIEDEQRIEGELSPEE